VSRSDNTEWHREQPPSWRWWQFQRGAGRDLRRRWQKQQRQQQKVALRQMDEPEPTRPRGSVKYDYW
jgi:hypothetical protein